MTAPILDASATPAFPSVAQRAANPSGVTVSALLADGSITDPDGGAIEAIAIEAVDPGLGSWQYSLDGGAHWIAMQVALLNSDTNRLSLLLGPTASVRLLPFGDLQGTLEHGLTFRAWDTSDGKASGTYAVATPGTGAFSAASDTVAVTVTPANDPGAFAASPGNGRVQVPVGPGFDEAWAVALQPDGRIVVAGGGGSAGVFTVARLNRDGSPDGTFGDGGKLALSVGAGAAECYAATIQPDGRILLAGTASNGANFDFAVVRLATDGSLDTTFGGSGSVLVPVGTGGDVANALAVQPDGRIVIAGTTAGTDADLAVVRLNANGSLDGSFGTNGKATVAASTISDYGNCVALQPDGKILVGGTTITASVFAWEEDFVVFRLNANGTPDGQFGASGRVRLPVGNVPGYTAADGARGIALQPDGRILLAGDTATEEGYAFAVVRVNANGTPDTGFGSGGKAVFGVAGDWDRGHAIALQDDGAIVVAGNASFLPDGDHVAVARLNADGSFDAGFGTGGKALVPTTGTETTHAVLVQPDGRIVVAGRVVADGGDSDFGVVRLNPDGTPDTAFGATGWGGIGGTLAYTENAAPVVLDADVVVYDPELAALDAGAGNYAGAGLTLARAGGADAQDLFGATGRLAFVGADALLDGVRIGSVDTGAGTLHLVFADGATQARVNAALQSITYANASDAPPASLEIAWTFRDDDAGTGPAATGRVTVNVAAVNDAPVALPASAQGTEDAVLEGTLAASDADGDAPAFRLASAPAHGSVVVEPDGRYRYTPGANFHGDDGFGFVAADGLADSPEARVTLAIAPVNDAPAGSVAVAGLAVLGQALSASHTLSDADGLGPIAWQWRADGVDIDGATASTLALGPAQLGRAITALARYTDGDGTAEQVASAPTAAVAAFHGLAGTDGPDRIDGIDGPDSVSALAGDDTVDGLGGDDTVDGGPGTDTVIAGVPLSGITGYTLGADELTLNTTAGTLSLQHVERIRFDDALVALDTQAPHDGEPGGHLWQAAALYRLAFGAIPDTAALSQWSAQADRAADMGALAQAMLGHYAPGLPSEALVAYLYQALLHAAPEPAVLQSLVAMIGPGQAFATQGEFFAYAASLPPNAEQLVGFAGSVQLLDPAWFG